MQLHAYQKDALIFVDDAEKGASYTCIDCGQEVRVRGGRFRVRHFFHFKPRAGCRPRRKSSIHQRIQNRLATLFPKGDIVLEALMPDGKRRADAFWTKGKTVFEVQCSPITLMEVKRRENDYRIWGYRVIWLLSDTRFNKYFASPAELYLREKMTYYVDRNGDIYDQFERFRYRRRVRRAMRCPIDLRKPGASAEKIPLPEMLKKRTGSVYGDLLDRAHRFPLFREALFALEKEPRMPIFKTIIAFCKKTLTRGLDALVDKY